MKPSIKIPVFNGSLECEFRKYTIFSGRLREFREEGGVVKTDEERRAMAEKHRFKKNREFKKRLEEMAENEVSDIRKFKFRSLDHDPFEARNQKSRRESRPSGDRFEDHSERDSRPGRGPRGGRPSERDRRNAERGFAQRDSKRKRKEQRDSRNSFKGRKNSNSRIDNSRIDIEDED